MPSHKLTDIPVFPLPDYYLFPGVVAPLQIFETRYRRLMSDLMDGPGRLVIAPYPPDGPKVDAGPVLPEVGTLVEIMRHEELPDGRWLILVAALERVTLAEVPSERLYRLVDAVIQPEPEVKGEPADALRDRLVAGLKSRAEGQWSAPDVVALGRLADVLLHALDLNVELAGKAYFEPSPFKRAAMALAWLDLKAEAAE